MTTIEMIAKHKSIIADLEPLTAHSLDAIRFNAMKQIAFCEREIKELEALSN